MHDEPLSPNTPQDEIPTSGAGASGPAGPDLEPGDRIGPYVIRKVLGEGGFGIVYQADQTEPVKRKVAIKVVKPGMDSRAVLSRFEAERQSLAVMNHPSIATVLDAGRTPQGRPYFVMELVRGEAITTFCDRQKLPVSARIELMRRVCEAVQHAHNKGVIHRDLKPSNILVSYEDRVAIPKVIDFGVAKALNDQTSDLSINTRQGQMIGTPNYMSPEQAEMSALDIDTRSDIYSLGVVLYELLTGELPFAEPLREASVADIPRIIREVEARKPSTRIASGEDGHTMHRSASRDATPSALRRQISGDLDWVVMRCLEKDRERRYDTPSALADDLARYLKGEPVEAGPPTAIYRARKFARRHRVGIGVTTALGLTLIAGVITSAAFAVAESRARHDAEEAKTAAEISEARAIETVAFLKKLLTSIDPELAQETDTALIRTILDDASREIDSSLERHPLVEAELRHTIATAYASVGALDKALAHRRALITLLERAAPERTEDILEAKRMLGATLLQLDQTDEAERILTAVRDQSLAEFGADAQLTLQAREDLASNAEGAGRLEDAERGYREVLARRRAIQGEHDEHTLGTMNNLGYLLSLTGRFDEARPLLEAAIEGFVASKGPDSIETLHVKTNYALLLRDLGHTEEGDAMVFEVLEQCRRVLDSDHPQLLTALNNAAIAHGDRGELDLSEAELRESLGGLRRRFGEHHPTTLSTLHNLGWLLQMQGREEDARPFVEAAARGRLARLGPGAEDTVISVNNFGSMMVALGQGEEALDLYRAVADGAESVRGVNDPWAMRARHNLGWLLRKLDRPDEALEHLRRAMDAREEALGPDDPDTLFTLYNLAAASIAAGHADEALAYSMNCYERNVRVYGESDEETAFAIDLVANSYELMTAMGDESAAEPAREWRKRCDDAFAD